MGSISLISRMCFCQTSWLAITSGSDAIKLNSSYLSSKKSNF